MSTAPDVLPLGSCVLTGRFIALEPLTQAHHDGLRDALNDEALWRYMPVRGFGEYFEPCWATSQKEIAQGSRIAYAVRRLSDNAIVGTTSYLAITPPHGRVEIGWTCYARQVHATAVNPEAKFLLLENAFEKARYHRVELKTCSTNARSRAAILKLGAKEEGTLRNHMWMWRQYWRDTVYYSILADEWPAVKAKLQARIATQAE